MIIIFPYIVLILTRVVLTKQPLEMFKIAQLYAGSCDRVCMDLPADDMEPVCMMYSRYKRGYQFFANLCQARRTICTENMIVHMVHPSRCMKSGQYFMPVN